MPPPLTFLARVGPAFAVSSLAAATGPPFALLSSPLLSRFLSRSSNVSSARILRRLPSPNPPPPPHLRSVQGCAAPSRNRDVFVLLGTPAPPRLPAKPSSAANPRMNFKVQRSRISCSLAHRSRARGTLDQVLAVSRIAKLVQRNIRLLSDRFAAAKSCFREKLVSGRRAILDRAIVPIVPLLVAFFFLHPSVPKAARTPAR